MNLKLTSAQLLALLLGLVRERRRRRNLMFVLCLGVLVLVGAGFFLFQEWLEGRPLVFLGYWGFTGVAAILMLLLAFYDMLRVSRE